jgi:F-type H+-transporting ATPase subunit b
MHRYGPGFDWSGHEHLERVEWHRILHFFGWPFYFIEYGFAQLAALQIWLSAKRDRAEIEQLLAQQRAQLEAARGEAQQIIAESRSTAEKMRGDMLAQTKHQQEEMIEQARRVIEGEKAAAIADLRREAVDLAIAGATRVIEKNLDSAGNRQIVESFLASLDGAKGTR